MTWRFNNRRARPLPRNLAPARQDEDRHDSRRCELARTALATPYDIAVIEAGCIPWS